MKSLNLSLMTSTTAVFGYAVEVYDWTYYNRFTSMPHDITIGGNVYTSNEKLVSVEPIRISTTVDRAQFKLVIADKDMTDADSLETGVRITVYSVVMEPSNIAQIQTFMIYRGIIDEYGYTVEASEAGSIALNITCSNPMTNLDQKRFMELSKYSARERNGNDSCCDTIYEGSEGLVLKWGKV